MGKYDFITKKILEDKYKNFTIKQISEYFGCSCTAIRTRLIKYNIQARNPSEAAKVGGGFNHNKNCNCCICKAKRHENVGENNSNYRHGKCIINKCIDCGKEIYSQAIRCQPCFHKLYLGSNNPNYTNGKTTVDNHCVDCGNIISYDATRCRSCSNIKIQKEGSRKGKKNGHYGKPAANIKRVYYKDVCMRSSWETAYAKWLDENCIKWLYEPKAFEITYEYQGDIKENCYWPDFYLPELNEWVEIKGWWRGAAKNKFDAFKNKYKDCTIKLLMQKDLEELNII
jgi:hypothetical protein